MTRIRLVQGEAEKNFNPQEERVLKRDNFHRVTKELFGERICQLIAFDEISAVSDT